jgi:methylglutaconyl-CoA hydratase
MYTTLKIEHHDRVATIWMDRPDVFNAFDEQLITDLHSACKALDADPSVRVVVLGGVGKHFSAGADLNWMKRASAFGEEENKADARLFASMLHTLSTLSKPTVARVQGAALGGGTGLAAACDMAIATTDAMFATSEVKFGIIPAVISPYVLRAIGPRHALRYFQTGERFTAHRAHEIGLVTELCGREELDAKVQSLVDLLIAGAPLAQKAAKDLIAAINGRAIDATICEETAHRISRQRATDEAKDGIGSFLEKRKPAWLS